MSDKRLFDAGDTVATFTGQAGIVIPADGFSAIRDRVREGKRPGHYFAPGCCHHPDYVLQVPVLFEDDTYDVMRAMNIRKVSDLSSEKSSHLKRLLRDRTA